MTVDLPDACGDTGPILDPLAARIAAFVRSWGTDGDFESLALDLFRYQYTRNDPYRRFCESRGAAPGIVNSWYEIPAAPAAAFRSQTLNCNPQNLIQPAARFRTSGTTASQGGIPAENRGVHWMDVPALQLYTLSLHVAFRRLASRAAGLPIRAILPPYSQAPDSSLSFMVSSLAAAADGASPGSASFHWKDGGPDLLGALARLKKDQGPVLLFSTAFGLLELLESLPAPLVLHPESILIETGGFKGRRRSLDRHDLYALASARLGIALKNIGSEYGMCEMASQFYDYSLAAAGQSKISPDIAADPPPIKVGPPWVKTRIIDPVTGDPAAADQPGLLRHFDLCNFNSVLAIQTMDLATPSSVPGTAAEGFILQGRLAQAPPRGCSLTVEEWADRRRSGGSQ